MIRYRAWCAAFAVLCSCRHPAATNGLRPGPDAHDVSPSEGVVDGPTDIADAAKPDEIGDLTGNADGTDTSELDAVDADATLVGNDVDAVDDTGTVDTTDSVAEMEDVSSADSGNSDAASFPVGAGKAPTVPIGSWPPPCDDPHTYADSNKGDAPNCWAPPNSWCSKPASQVLEPACSSSGEFCCIFPVNCKPCDWVSCFGCPESGSCPEQCKAQPDPWNQNAVWATADCIQFAKILTSKDCALCGTDVYCK